MSDVYRARDTRLPRRVVLLQRDGFRCLYAVPVDPESRARKGEPFPAWHQHDASRQWGSTGLGSAVATGIFVVDLRETTGHLWWTNLPSVPTDR